MIAFIVGLLSLGLVINLLLTMLGLYNVGFFVFVIIILFSFYRASKYQNIKKKFFNKTNLVIFSIIAITSILNFVFFSDYKFEGGHDQGVYAEHAAWIYKGHKLNVDDQFSNVLTFPGYKLSNNKIITHFPPLYPLYLSYFNFLTPFTLPYKIATMFLYVLFLLLIYSISKILIKNNILKIFLILLISTNYYTLTIFRTTYVETFYSIFLLCMTLTLLKMAKGNNFWFLIGLFAGAANCFTRSEGIANLIVYVLVGLVIYIVKNKLNPKNGILITIISFIFLSLSVWTCYLYVTNYYNYLPTFGNSIGLVKGFGLGTGHYNIYLFYFTYFLNVIKPIGVSFIFLIILFLLLKIRKSKDIFQIILLVSIVLPQIIFTIIPGIAPYLPWYFRRIYPSLIVYSIITFIVLLNSSNLFSQRIKNILLVIIFIINLNFTASIMFYKETGTINLINLLAKYNNTSSSIVFLDRYGIESIAPLLFFYKNINSVYDRLPIAGKELYECLLYKNNNIYIVSTSITPNSKLNFYGTTLNNTNLVNTIERGYNVLNGSCDVRNFLVNSWSFKKYSDINDICKDNNPPKDRAIVINTVYIYKIKLNQFDDSKNCSLNTSSQLVEVDFVNEFKMYYK